MNIPDESIGTVTIDWFFIQKTIVTLCTFNTLERILKILIDVGLCYLELGQTLTTSYGGEGHA